ncbi:MAG: SEC-C metal-binding domain-containing protein [Clostridium cadaveris]|uniref:YecA family protein n=1 Tax=Clostridium cadaveris TaxID=1529 RepID=UPI002A85329E|nr:SEC-C metal-binding domain-containing protein [Clostridium cadaveris]
MKEKNNISNENVEILNGVEEIKESFEEELEELVNKNMGKKLKRVSKRACSNNLLELLTTETKDTLKIIMDNLNISYKSSDKKEVLINNINENYKNSIINLSKCMNLECYDVMEILCKNNGILLMEELDEKMDTVVFMEQLGIIYTALKDNELYACIPSQIKEILSEIDKSKLVYNSEIIKLFKGMLYYYGVLTIEDFMDRLPQDVEIELSLDELDMLLAMEEISTEEYIYIDGLGVNSLMDNEEQLEANVNNSEKLRDYKKLTKHEILKACGKEYIGDRKNYKELEKFIKEFYTITEDNFDEMLISTYQSYQRLGQNDLIKDMIENFPVPQYIQGEFTIVMNDVCKRIPVWSLGGYTLAENNTYVRSDKEVKVGRNEPCPCGSGKKYKKCCGKNA